MSKSEPATAVARLLQKYLQSCSSNRRSKIRTLKKRFPILLPNVKQDWKALHPNVKRFFQHANLVPATAGHASTLDGIVFGIMSQFMPIHNAHGYSYIPQSKKHESELNMMHLTCNVIQKNQPGSGPNTVQLPVMAYLSSDVLDQCVQSVGRFPTTDQFIQYLNTRMIEKAAAFAVPPPQPSPPVASAPSLSELDGGRKKTRRIMSKKRKHSKKIRHHHRH